jgi:poly(3-hydroxybutyrate) depolymerase
MKHASNALFGILLSVVLGVISMSTTAHTLDSLPAPTGDLVEAVQLDIASASGKSPGCQWTAKHSTGVFTWTVVDGNNKTRKFLVQVPGDYDSTKPYSLNFVFHGAGGSSAQSYGWGLQAVAGASEAGIFVFPDGVPYQSYGVGWDDTKNGYDLPFFDHMVKDVETYFCVDKARVFVAGFSWGGDFATSLVCNRGNVIRAAAINSSTDEYTQKADYLTYQGMPCSTTVHPAVRFGHALGGDAEYPAPYFANTSKLLQHFNACSSVTTKAASSTTAMTCSTYNSCSAQFVECSFSASIGHNLPPNWAKDTWAFFSSFK